MHLRRGTAGQLYNVIVAHFADFAIDIDGASTVAQLGTALTVDHSIFFDNGNQVVWDDTTDNDAMLVEGTYFRDSARLNMEMDPQITSALDPVAPSFKPAPASPAMTSGMALSPPADGFFEAVTFIGAVGAEDWTTGWTSFPPN
jgi:hypothetical protein